ncbi:MAG: deoxyribodipyrimidine photolyase, partial [Pseudomonadota bacterium]
ENMDFSCDAMATVHVENSDRDARVDAFDREALADVRARNAGGGELPMPDALADWVADNALEQIVMPYCPVGPVRDALMPALAKLHIETIEIRREWDSAFWPAATAGFFKVKKRIPKVLDNL